MAREHDHLCHRRSLHKIQICSHEGFGEETRMKDDCQCTASLNEKDSRAELWKYVLGTDKLEIPLRHPLYITNPNFPGKLFLEGDARKLSADQKARLVERMAQKFNIGKEEVEQSLEAKDAIVPILSDGCINSICSLHFMAML